jgi:hypothetical protein
LGDGGKLETRTEDAEDDAGQEGRKEKTLKLIFTIIVVVVVVFGSFDFGSSRVAFGQIYHPFLPAPLNFFN